MASQLDFISLIQCPYCGGRLKRVEENILACKCDEYPIVYNILYLKKNDFIRNRRIVDLIRQGKTIQALWESLSENGRIIRVLAFSLYVFEKLIRVTIPLSWVVFIFSFIPSTRSWFLYLKRRLQSKDFQFSLFILNNLPKKGLIVDVGSGLSQAWQKHRTLTDGPLYIGVDKTFFSLFLARRHLHPAKNILVCSDIEHGFPFKDRVASIVLFVDGFFHVYNKKRAIADIHRIMKSKGLFSLINVYDYSDFTRLLGYGISSKELYKLLRLYFLSISYVDHANISFEKRSLETVPTVEVGDANPFGFSVFVWKR